MAVAIAGVTQTSTDGVVLVAVLDTSGNPVTGAVVTSTPSSTVRYNGSNGLPSSSTTGSTGSDGVAYLLNVPTGCVNVTATATTGVVYSTAIIHAFPSSEAISLTQVIQSATH